MSFLNTILRRARTILNTPHISASIPLGALRINLDIIGGAAEMPDHSAFALDDLGLSVLAIFLELDLSF